MNESYSSKKTGSFERIFVILVVGLLTIGDAIPSLSLLVSPPLESGFVARPDTGQVVNVRPGGPAAQAGLRLGDRLKTPLPISLYNDSAPKTYDLTIEAPGRERTIGIQPKPQPLSASDASLILGGFCLYVLSFGVGSMLLIARPSPMTWGFFAYCVFQRLPLASLYVPGPLGIFYANWFALIVVISPGLTGLLVFAARFPSGIATGWRRIVERWSYVFIPISLVAVSYPPLNELLGLKALVPWWIVVVVADVLLTALVVDAFVRAGNESRQRIVWIAALPVSLAVRATLAFGLNYSLPQFVFIIGLVDVIVPLSVLYAVLRHQLFDIRFVVSRAATLACLSAAVILFFLLADYFVSKNLAATKLAITLDLTIAVAFGFFLEFVRRRVERAIELVVFRDRRNVENALTRTARALESADSADAIDRLLIAEVTETLGLKYAAIYRLEKPDYILCAASRGYAPETRLAAGDPFILHLKAERKTTFDELRFEARIVPILVRGQLYGFALFGAHTNGTRLDPEEIKLVERVLVAAGFAYEHAESEALIARLERQELELETLRSKLARRVERFTRERG